MAVSSRDSKPSIARIEPERLGRTWFGFRVELKTFGANCSWRNVQLPLQVWELEILLVVFIKAEFLLEDGN